MKKKPVLVLVMLVLAVFTFAGCADKKEKCDKRFTYNWYIYSITSEGKTTYFIEDEPFVPEFSSSDGITCTFKNKGKSHKGTITKIEENRYDIDLEDSNARMEAEISEDTLTLTLNDKMVLVFKRAD